jgi:hypothetical protein
MGKHRAERARRGTTRLIASAGAAALMAGGFVAVIEPGAEAMPPNPITVSVSPSSSTTTSGDLLAFTVTVTNTSSKPTVEPSYSLNDKITNGTEQPPYVQQISGPDAWTCQTTKDMCDLFTTMPANAVDKFTLLVQAGTAGSNVTDAATVTLWDGDSDDRTGKLDPDTPTSTGTGSSTVTSGTGGGGGGATTVTGFCPNTGCDIRSSSSQPTATNPTVADVHFPAFSGSGFTYSYVLQTGKTFCAGPCTDAAANLGDLTVSSLPQFTDPNHPIQIFLTYDTTVTQGASQGQGTAVAYKSTDGTTGTPLVTCKPLQVGPPCAQVPSRDGNNDLDTEIDLLSTDPWIGNTYVI